MIEGDTQSQVHCYWHSSPEDVQQLNKGLAVTVKEWQDINRQSKQPFVTV